MCSYLFCYHNWQDITKRIVHCISSALRISRKFPFLSQNLSSDILLIVYKNKDVFNISKFFPLKKSKISSLGAMWHYELSLLQPLMPRRVPSYSQELPRGIFFYSQGCQAELLLTARGATQVPFYTGCRGCWRRPPGYWRGSQRRQTWPGLKGSKVSQWGDITFTS